MVGTEQTLDKTLLSFHCFFYGATRGFLDSWACVFSRTSALTASRLFFRHSYVKERESRREKANGEVGDVAVALLSGRGNYRSEAEQLDDRSIHFSGFFFASLLWKVVFSTPNARCALTNRLTARTERDL